MTRKKAVVAMSGGVDSSVAAALLVEADYDVTGIMLKLWRGEAANNDSGCCNVGAAEDARRVADALDIPFYVHNFAERFEETVVANFHADYAAGRTPNPCVRCNQWVKFGSLMERAEALGADVLATGHYARIRRDGDSHRLLRGADRAKDQSYVLWMLGPRELARTLFPVGELQKSETRRIAAGLGLRTATKPDSQEICFVPSGDLGAYVENSIPEAAAPGPILSTTGEQLGTHRGIGHYTVGQRKGLGISLGHPVFVNAIDRSNNAIVVGDRSELTVAGCSVQEVGWVHQLRSGSRTFVQHRAHGDAFPATVHVKADGVDVDFDAPVEAVAPGQSAAFYSIDDPDELLGGGVIAATVPVAVAV